jgi:preprotein translocase subunit SecE
MARDRKRAKQRQRRAAQRQPQPARAGRARREERAAPSPPAADEPDVVEAPDAPDVVEAADEAEVVEATEDRADADSTIPDLEHGSAGADIAKAAIAAGAVDPDEVREELEADVGRRPEEGEVYADELGDDEGEVASDGGAASAAVGRPARRERARVERRGGNRVTIFLRNSWEELKRVQWPDRRQVAQATAVVVVFVIVIGLFLGGADYVFSKLVDAII